MVPYTVSWLRSDITLTCRCLVAGASVCVLVLVVRGSDLSVSEGGYEREGQITAGSYDTEQTITSTIDSDSLCSHAD